jgi:hypothetical protein
MHLDQNAQPETEIPLDMNATSGALLDEKRNIIWMALYQGEVLRYDLAAHTSRRLPLKDANLALEPDTGYLWAATPEGLYRVTPEGTCAAVYPSEKPAAKWIAVVPAGGLP